MNKDTIIRDVNMVFVFGSNLSGIHGAGSARVAAKERNYPMGKGEGYHLDPRTGLATYALPTKGLNITDMKIYQIRRHVQKFIEFAQANPEMKFKVTQVGCGLAGHVPSIISAMFESAPKNCYFDSKWAKYMRANVSYWGTY